MWGKLWLHESERVYADRLVSQQVRQTPRDAAPLRCSTGAVLLLETEPCWMVH